MRDVAAFSVLGLFLLACGGSGQPAEAPTAEPMPDAAEAPPDSSPKPADESASESPPKEAAKPEKAPVAEPVFTDNMSVADAVKAVPQGSERANIDQETLSKPIQDFALYEPCNPGTAHIKMKIAVWDGKAVGLDLTSTPKNDKLVACIKDRIKAVTWKAHVKSLNTVEYSF